MFHSSSRADPLPSPAARAAAVPVKRVDASKVRWRTTHRLVAQLAASVLLVLALLLVATAAAAAGIDRQEAARLARQEAGGRVLAIEPAVVDWRAVWRVKLLSRAGDVTVLLLDAQTGRVCDAGEGCGVSAPPAASRPSSRE